MAGLSGRFGWALFVVLAGCGGGGTSDVECVETAEALTAALASASDGDVVHACSGRFEGAFAVPPGVSLEGAGRLETTIAGPEGAFALRLRPGAGQESRVSHLAVEWLSRAAIVATGEGTVSLSSLDVAVASGTATGIGIAAESLSGFEVDDVSVWGPLTEENASAFPPFPTLAEWTDGSPAFGLVLVRVSGAEITDLDLRGFSAGGAQLVESVATWTGGSVCGNLEVGVLVHAGSATIEGLSVCDLFEEETRLDPSIGLYVAGAAVVTSTDLSVTGNEEGSVGVVQDGSSSSHSGLVVTGNLFRGVQVQRAAGTAEAPSIRLADVDLSHNGFGGLVAVESSGVVVEGAIVDETSLRSMIDGLGGVVDVGDGIQIVRCADPDVPCEGALSGISLRDVTMTNNARVGLLVSANNAAAAGISIEGVTVSGEGTALGAIVQLADDEPAGWASIDRAGATVANDESFSGVLETVGVVDPDYLPAQDLSVGGLGAALGDLD